MNRKGFTLVELLAVLVILGIVMTVAVPNTVSILDKNKKRTFVSDAKRFASLVENEIRKNSNLDTSLNNIMLFHLASINDGTLEKDPDNKKYDQSDSFVAVKKEKFKDTNNSEYGIFTYTYYVYLKGENRSVTLSTVGSDQDTNCNEDDIYTKACEISIDSVIRNSAEADLSVSEILTNHGVSGEITLIDGKKVNN